MDTKKVHSGYRKQTGLTPAAIDRALPDPVDEAVKKAIPVANPKHEPEDKKSRERRVDPISDAIGAHRYYHKMTWEWLTKEIAPSVFRKMSVTRYYPEPNIALDMNLVHGDDDPKDLKLKEKILATKGVKYFHIKTADDVKRMLKQIGRPT